MTLPIHGRGWQLVGHRLGWGLHFLDGIFHIFLSSSRDFYFLRDLLLAVILLVMTLGVCHPGSHLPHQVVYLLQRSLASVWTIQGLRGGGGGFILEP